MLTFLMRVTLFTEGWTPWKMLIFKAQIQFLFSSEDGAMFPSMNNLSIIKCICMQKKLSTVIKNQTTGYLYYIRSVSKQFISNVCITTHKEIITIADNENIKTIFHRECTSHFDFFYKQLWSRYILQISSQKDYDKLFPQSVMTFMHG